ncbi:MAG: TPM domain-containing protein [Ignavibacteriae bacterium]|nr:TPM domain-containing protein [Flavobacteriales bacterium]MCB0730646.1 TPM domain-containing protein [Ignavibacteriota bacterium]MCB9210226.1 TPM domain-containing protein [Ignavibacteriales bacterium]MCB9219021.1 TPM domain-containing protein [Ignavibacteriales bacterium]MCB9259606.1 TPM domain-containing protein [Ignavibacteriales bacterium]
MKFYWITYFLFGSIFFAQDIPKLSKYANDFTQTFSSDQVNYLNSGLKSFDDSTSNQVVFLMINTLDGYPIEMYTHETSEQNGIGTKENNNGVLFCVVKNDRKMRIEVGYGLEGALPDALASSIIRNDVTPYFKRNQYYEGTIAGLNGIMAATKGEYKGNGSNDNEEGFPIGFIIFMMFIIFMLISRNRGRRGPGGFIYYGGGLGGSSGGGFSSGGSFGGFSGGGGSFGGGGASGSW